MDDCTVFVCLPREQILFSRKARYKSCLLIDLIEVA